MVQRPWWNGAGQRNNDSHIANTDGWPIRHWRADLSQRWRDQLTVDYGQKFPTGGTFLDPGAAALSRSGPGRISAPTTLFVGGATTTSRSRAPLMDGSGVRAWIIYWATTRKSTWQLRANSTATTSRVVRPLARTSTGRRAIPSRTSGRRRDGTGLRQSFGRPHRTQLQRHNDQ